MNHETTRQMGILFGWSCRLEQSATGHSFGSYIVNVHKTYSRHLFYVPTLLTNCFQSTSSEHCKAPF